MCECYGFKADIKFTIKSYILTNAELSVLVLFLSTVHVLGYLIRVFELPFHRTAAAPVYRQFDEHFNAIWVVVITISTVGYGDMAPYTNLGRFIAIFSCMWGSVMMALVVVTVT